jgi:hypothetical protein
MIFYQNNLRGYQKIPVFSREILSSKPDQNIKSKKLHKILLGEKSKKYKIKASGAEAFGVNPVYAPNADNGLFMPKHLLTSYLS